MSKRLLTRLAIALGILFLVCFALIIYSPTFLPTRAAKAYLKHAGVAERTVLVDGHRISYFETTPIANMPDRPLLLIHGLGASKLDWVPLIVPLSKAGFHVYALDLLGYGDSDAPKEASYSLKEEEDTVLHFMDQVKLSKTDVAGWSMGGWVAMKMGLDAPQRIRRLVLLDSAGVYFPFTYDSTLFTPTTRPELDRLVYMLEPEKPFIHLPWWATSGILRKNREKQWVIHRSFSDMVNGHELLDFRLAGLHVPTLLIWGTEDKLTPFKSGQRIHALIEGSSLVGIQGCGHLAAGECATQAAAVMIPFLDAAVVPPPFERTIPGPKR